eukprot:Em0001g971a
MATILGPRYLQYVIKEMKELLTRSYQLHVLAFGLHSLLKGVSPVLKAGDLDSCMQLISMVGVASVHSLSHNTLPLLPFYRLPKRSPNRREGDWIGELVAKIPESKTPQSLNTYEITAQYLSPHLLPDLLSVPKQVLEEKQSARMARVVEEVFRRVGQGVMRNDLFTAPALALLVFVHGLVRESIPQLTSNTGGGHKPVFWGSVAAYIVTEFALHTLSSQDVKVTSRAALCLIWVVRMPLPSLVTHIGSIATSLFNILRRYARAGAAAVGNNRELVVAAFKAMTVVVRDFPQYEVEEEELRHLLTFVEEDIMDYRRHSTAFPLFKNCPSLLTQMVFAPNVDSYAEQSGRESVLEFLVIVFKKFPEVDTVRRSEMVSLISCGLAMTRLESLYPTPLPPALAVHYVTPHIHPQLLHKRLAAQSLGLLVEMEGKAFEKRLSTFLPSLFTCLDLYHGEEEGEDVGYDDGAVGVHKGTSDEENGEEEEVTSTVAIVAKGAKPRDLLWLIQKMCRIARLEASNHPKEPL